MRDREREGTEMERKEGEEGGRGRRERKEGEEGGRGRRKRKEGEEGGRGRRERDGMNGSKRAGWRDR